MAELYKIGRIIRSALCLLSILFLSQSAAAKDNRQTTKRVLFSTRIKTAPYTLLVKKSLSECMDHCTRVDYCMAVAFDRSTCRLYNDTITDGDLEAGRGSVVLKEDFEVSKANFCETIDCDTPIECGPIQEVADATVLGNQVYIGARLMYICKSGEGVFSVTCENDGQWSTLPDCTATGSSNPCAMQAHTGTNLFFPHQDPTKFIQCDAAGTSHVQQCQTSLIWNQNTGNCDLP